MQLTQEQLDDPIWQSQTIAEIERGLNRLLNKYLVHGDESTRQILAALIDEKRIMIDCDRGRGVLAHPGRNTKASAAVLVTGQVGVYNAPRESVTLIEINKEGLWD